MCIWMKWAGLPLGAMSVEQKFHEGLALLSIGTLYGEDTKGVLRMERSEIWTYESGRVSFGQMSASGRLEAELAQTLMGVLTDIVSTRGAPAINRIRPRRVKAGKRITSASRAPRPSVSVSVHTP